MSRSGYVDDVDEQWQFILWRGAVASAIKGKRGQALLTEMLAALDAMPVKRLIADELESTDRIPISHWGLIETPAFCAIGSVGQVRGVDMKHLDPYDASSVAGTFGIASALAREIVFINDEAGPYRETPEDRFLRVRNWIVANIKQDTPQ